MGGGIGALLTVGIGLGLLLLNLSLGEKLISLSYDLLFRNRPITRPSELVLVYLDDDSHRDLAQPYDGPWDRGLYARLLERITAEHGRATSFDIIFSGTNFQHLEGDERFARAIKANGRVVLGADLTQAAGGGMTFIRAIDPFFYSSAGWGMGQLYLEPGIVVRRHLPMPGERGKVNYSTL